jgi:intracellular septation protein
MKLFIDFFPALAFLIALFIPESRGEAIYFATKVLIAATVLQLAASWALTRRVERQYLIILAVVVILGGATLMFQDERFIKWKPTIVFWIFSLICLGSDYVGAKNIAERFLGTMFNAPATVWFRVNLSFTLFFLSLGFINLFVAYNFDTETWAFFKVFGFMGINFIFILALVIYLSRYMIEQDQNKE